MFEKKLNLLDWFLHFVFSQNVACFIKQNMKNPLAKLFAPILLGAILLSACLGERSLKNDSEGDDTLKVADEGNLETIPDEAWCFLRLDGEKHQDSTYVFIRLKGDSVSGVHHWVPNLKDARRGTIIGEKRGDTINVVWNYMQEGISDTSHIAFIMEDGSLKQQPYLVRPDGRQVRDATAAFEITYKPVDCPKFE